MQALEQAIDANTKVWDEFTASFDQHSKSFYREVQNIVGKFGELEEQKEKCTRLYREDDIDEEELVNINVGGKIITTNRGILTQQKGTILEAMFSGRWDKKFHRDELGYIFLDMNPVCFQSIVDYLSDNKYSSEKKLLQPHCTRKELEPILEQMIEYFGVKLCQNAQDSISVESKEEPQQIGEHCSDEASDEELNLDEFLSNIKKSVTDEKKALEKAKRELKKATQAWEKEQPFIQNFTAPTEKDIINFNVRGTYITVKRSTLRIFKGSVLERQFDDSVWTEQYANEGTRKDGSYKQVTFIDHDPYSFVKIIDQLRLKAMAEKSYNPLALYRICKTEHETFKKTVDYYFPGELAQLIWEKHSFDSCILSADECSNINDWLSKEGYKSDLKLLYRASLNGWQASTFHDKCDNQGPTITIIQSTGGYIFGGFCDTAWSSSGDYKASPKAFIFTIKCYGGLDPTKMKLKSSNDGYAVYHNSSYGPIFGGGHDISVYDMANNNSESYTNVGHTYECPAGQTGHTFLTGSQNFQAKEVEVFSVQ